MFPKALKYFIFTGLVGITSAHADLRVKSVQHGEPFVISAGNANCSSLLLNNLVGTARFRAPVLPRYLILMKRAEKLGCRASFNYLITSIHAQGSGAPTINNTPPVSNPDLLVAASTSPILAILDSGLDPELPLTKAARWVNDKELNGKPGVDDDGNGYVDDIYGVNMFTRQGDTKDVYGHGTMVASVADATYRETLGIKAPNFRILPIRMLNDDGESSVAILLKAIDYASRAKASVMNMSFVSNYTVPQLKAALLKNSALTIVAAGNDSANIDKVPSFPASYGMPNLLAIASCDASMQISYFSNFGSKATGVCVPGENLAATGPGKVSASFTGTSASAAYASGLAMAVEAADQTLVAKNIKSTLLASALRNGALRSMVDKGRYLTSAILSKKISLPAAAAVKISPTPTSSAKTPAPISSGALLLTAKKGAAKRFTMTANIPATATGKKLIVSCKNVPMKLFVAKPGSSLRYSLTLPTSLVRTSCIASFGKLRSAAVVVQ